MVRHRHPVWPPELVEVLLVAVVGQCLQQRVFAVVEIDLLDPVFVYIPPDHLFRAPNMSGITNGMSSIGASANAQFIIAMPDACISRSG